MKLLLNLTDQDPVTTKSLGIINVSLGLLRGFAAQSEIRELHVLTNSSLGCPVKERASGTITYHRANQPPPRRWGRLLWDQWGVVRAAREITPDWLFLPKGFPPGVLSPGCRVGVYLHDVIWEYYREQTENPFPFLERVYFPWLSRVALRKADLVTTSTQWNVERMRHHEPKARVERVGLGFDAVPPLWKEGETCGQDLLLLTSRLPHKLTPQAVAWVKRWKQETGDRRAVHGVGGLPAGVSWPEGDGWVLHPRLHGAAYAEVRRKCRSVIYLSAYEGFGMPPVEAQREGAFPLASDIPPHRENLPPECLFANDNYGQFRERLDASLVSPKPVAPSREWPDWNEVAGRITRLMLR